MIHRRIERLIEELNLQLARNRSLVHGQLLTKCKKHSADDAKFEA
jgi:hypothetical protein